MVNFAPFLLIARINSVGQQVSVVLRPNVSWIAVFL